MLEIGGAKLLKLGILSGGRRIRPIFVFGDAFVRSAASGNGWWLLAGRSGSTCYLRIIDWKGAGTWRTGKVMTRKGGSGPWRGDQANLPNPYSFAAQNETKRRISPRFVIVY